MTPTTKPKLKAKRAPKGTHTKAVVLNDRALRGLKPREDGEPYMVKDAKTQGLYIRVSPRGTRTWMYQYRWRRRIRRITLGPYPAVSLADARERAGEYLRAVKYEGRDPMQERREDRDAKTFAELADEYMVKHVERRRLRSRQTIERSLANRVPSAWRHRAVRDLTRRDVIDLLDDVTDRYGQISANRLRSLLHSVFRFAVMREYTLANPVDGTEAHTERPRERTLNDDEIRRLWQATEQLPLPAMRGYLRTLLLTGQRPGEVRDMRWSQVNLARAEWTIPGERYKTGITHVVPLSPTVVEMLCSLPRPNDGQDDFVFAGARGKRQQIAAKDTAGLTDFNLHDVRRTVMSSLSRLRVNRVVANKVLGHLDRKIDRVYDRHDYAQEKREALELWAAEVGRIVHGDDGSAKVAGRSVVVPFVGPGASGSR